VRIAGSTAGPPRSPVARRGRVRHRSVRAIALAADRRGANLGRRSDAGACRVCRRSNSRASIASGASGVRSSTSTIVEASTTIIRARAPGPDDFGGRRRQGHLGGGCAGGPRSFVQRGPLGDLPDFAEQVLGKADIPASAARRFELAVQALRHVCGSGSSLPWRSTLETCRAHGQGRGARYDRRSVHCNR